MKRPASRLNVAAMISQPRRLPFPRWLVGPEDDRSILDLVVQSVILVGLVLLGVGVVYATGGLPNAYAHLLYIPILLGGYYFGISGAVITALLAGLAVGPASALEMLPGSRQPAGQWLVRQTFFVAIGIIATLMMMSRNRNRARLRRSIRELYQAYGKSLQTFASLVALRDEQTAHHCERVAHNARVLGQAIDMSEHQLTELHWAGILHDLGKVSVPASILLKTRSLTDSEYAEIKKHASVGADILESISPRFLNIADGVRSHHENFDGSGYPQGLSGEGIPIAARILRLVDVFEAITSHRPYRDPMATIDAVQTIRDGVGTEFDPALVKCFLDLHARGNILREGDPIPHAGLDEHPLPGYSTLAEEAELK